jgi:UDP-N-acetylmuramyl pentapeptide phosphotransferase/UDP-N-acetylglucosamine-1-phosphate transferase
VVLSSLATLLSVAAFFVGYVLHNDWAVVVWWAVLPELLVFTLIYLAADFAKGTTRKQAVLSMLIALPAFITGVWFFKNLHL